MSGQHAHGGQGSVSDSLHGAVASPVASADAAVKLVCLFVFVLAVVLTPPEAIWAFGFYAVLVAVVAGLARIPATVLGRRLVVEVPFVVFALALPFIGSGPRTELLGVPLSIAGSWAAWAILAKATLGVAGSVVLAWSTSVVDLLDGLEHLHCPRVLVAITGFMVRYLDVIAAELHRLQIARISRGDRPRWIWQGRAVAATAGTMFVRSFERGERIQQAMVARGFTGTFPAATRGGGRSAWFPALVLPITAVGIGLAANVWT